MSAEDKKVEFVRDLAKALREQGVNYFEGYEVKLVFGPSLIPSGIGTSPSASGLSQQDEDELTQMMDDEPSNDPIEDPTTYGAKPPGYRRPPKRKKE